MCSRCATRATLSPLGITPQDFWECGLVFVTRTLAMDLLGAWASMHQTWFLLHHMDAQLDWDLGSLKA